MSVNASAKDAETILPFLFKASGLFTSMTMSTAKTANSAANIIGIIMNKAKCSVHRGSRRSGSLDRGRAFSAFDNDEQEDDE